MKDERKRKNCQEQKDFPDILLWCALLAIESTIMIKSWLTMHFRSYLSCGDEVSEALKFNSLLQEKVKEVNT